MLRGAVNPSRDICLRKAEISVKIGAWDKRGRRVNARRFEQAGALLFTTRAGLGERDGFFYLDSP
jgi:hypothetical protein